MTTSDVLILRLFRTALTMLLLLTGTAHAAWAQDDTPAGRQPELTEAEADSLRQTDGFVTASLLVTSPGEEGYSSLGHCAIRMECPAYGLDYCFSYELTTGDVATGYLAFFSGQSPAGFVAMETPVYLQRFRDEGRDIVQYTLNLTPQQKQELWQRLDENMMEGFNAQFDFLYHNCTSMSLIALQSQLAGERLVVKEWPEVMRHSTAYTYKYYTRQMPWMQFVLATIMGTRADEDIPKELCVAPEVMGEVMSHAVIIGPDGTERPALTGQPRQLQPQTLMVSHSWLTPQRIAIALLVLLLVLTLGQWLRGWRRLALTADVVLLVAQAAAGAALLYLVAVSRLFGQHWNWCLLLYSPLPLVAWLCFRRRAFYRRLSLFYGGAMLLLAVAAPLITAQLIAAHRLVAAAIAVRCMSCSLAKFSNDKKQ